MATPRTSFTGTVFPPGQTRQIACDLYLQPNGIVACPKDGGPQDGEEFLLPYERIQVRRGGLDLAIMVCTGGPEDPAVSCGDPAFPASLDASAGRAVAGAMAALKRTDRTRRGVKLGLLAAALLILVGIAFGGWFLISAGSRLTLAAIPISVDKTIGDQSIESMDLGGPVLKQAEVEHFVQAVVDRLDDHLVPPGASPESYAYKLTVRVVESNQINAFALPGGQIVVYTGLIKSASRAEQVAGVLGHEIAHVTGRHGMQGIIRGLGVVVAAQVLLGDVSGIVGIMTQGAMMAVLNGYSRDQERAADQEGARIAAAAGFDPAGLAEFFMVLKDQPGSQMPGLLQVLSTHPEHDERIAAIRALRTTLTVAPGADLTPLFLAAKEALGQRVGSASAAMKAVEVPAAGSASAPVTAP